ncbi:MAG TPA: SHOCT domain-containing protein [Ilumatobacteraceae bacterium]|nr:SHOCT domain-containing protein [Ilumatobacteraceae bacterium]
MLAYDYPLLGVFWSVFIFFLFLAWLMLLFRVFANIFRSDMGGVAKAIWSIFVIIVPFLGVLIYVIAHGDDMRSRDIAGAQQNEEAFRSYVQQTAGSGGVASELGKLSDLHASGVLTEAEFDTHKPKLLSS